jgi:hypothetical protein
MIIFFFYTVIRRPLSIISQKNNFNIKINFFTINNQFTPASNSTYECPILIRADYSCYLFSF